MQKPAKSVPFWNRLPQLLNLARYRSVSAASEKRPESRLDYEPIHLCINPLELHPLPGKEQHALSPAEADTQWSADTFQFLLEQVPSVQTVSFFCKQADPLAFPGLFRLIDQAYRFNGAKSTVYSQGWHLTSLMSEIMTSRLDRLVISMQAHRPSQYSLMTGRPLAHFVALRDQVHELVEQKRRSGHPLKIEISMLVDIHNFGEIPDMIRYAETLGISCIHFENLGADNAQTAGPRTIFSDCRPIVNYLEDLARTHLPNAKVKVVLPMIPERVPPQNRYCQDAYSTVSVDAHLNVSGCSRQLLSHEHQGKIWDEDFFNNPMYQWLRSVHCGQQTIQDLPEVPHPCRNCPNNT